jgi:uncharacterized protein with FMN-binding domain
VICVKRILLWGLSTVSALVLLLGYHTSTSAVLASSGTGSSFTGSLQGQGTTRTSRTGDTGTGTGDTVTGDAAQTAYGPVQLRLTMQGSTITNVTVLQFPSGNGRDVEINSYALPQLIQETLDAQGADIDMVSGATYTSAGYLESLQSALDRVSA